jgi:hypothetical protein
MRNWLLNEQSNTVADSTTITMIALIAAIGVGALFMPRISQYAKTLTGNFDNVENGTFIDPTGDGLFTK